MDSEFEKRMKLLDPSYVVPDSERVKNRKPVDFKSEPLRVNEAGLAIEEDTPVNLDMQQIYLDRMMQKESVDKLEELPEEEQFIQTLHGGTISESEQKALENLFKRRKQK